LERCLIVDLVPLIQLVLAPSLVASQLHAARYQAHTVVNNQFNQFQPQDLNELKKAWRLKFQD
jgi:hypothetical protein